MGVIHKEALLIMGKGRSVPCSFILCNETDVSSYGAIIFSPCFQRLNKRPRSHKADSLFLQTGCLRCLKLLNLVVMIKSQCYTLHNFILWEASIFMSYFCCCC